MVSRWCLDVYRIHIEPVCHFIRPLCSCYTTRNLSQYYVNKTSQIIGGRCLGTFICYMLPTIGWSHSFTAITEGKLAQIYYLCECNNNNNMLEYAQRNFTRRRIRIIFHCMKMKMLIMLQWTLLFSVKLECVANVNDVTKRDFEHFDCIILTRKKYEIYKKVFHFADKFIKWGHRRNSKVT